MKGVRRFRDELNKDLQDKKFARAFEEADVFVNLAIQIAKLRQEQGLNQKKLAKLLHTSQQTVSRLENPHNRGYSLKTLAKLAEAFHKKLSVQFI